MVDKMNILFSKHHLLISLILSYLLAVMSMNLKSPYFSMEAFIYTLPVVLAMLFFIKKNACLLFLPDNRLTREQVFSRDFFCMNYSFVLSGFLSLLFQYDNSDASAWWPLFVYLNYFFGMLFSVLFASMAKLLQAHRTYTLISSVIILIVFTFTKYWNVFLGNYYLEGYYTVLIVLSLIHLALCIMFKVNSN